jgi:hypothetical protein
VAGLGGVVCVFLRGVKEITFQYSQFSIYYGIYGGIY